MGNAGHGHVSYVIFKQALDSGDLARVESLAPGLPGRVSLSDALRILALMARHDDDRYERAAVKWVGRYLSEHPSATLDGAKAAAVWLDELPSRPERAGALAKLLAS